MESAKSQMTTLDSSWNVSMYKIESRASDPGQPNGLAVNQWAEVRFLVPMLPRGRLDQAVGPAARLDPLALKCPGASM